MSGIDSHSVGFFLLLCSFQETQISLNLLNLNKQEIDQPWDLPFLKINPFILKQWDEMFAYYLHVAYSFKSNLRASFFILFIVLDLDESWIWKTLSRGNKIKPFFYLSSELHFWWCENLIKNVFTTWLSCLQEKEKKETFSPTLQFCA